MIDTSNLTSLITAFRQITAQSKRSSETLNEWLQAIANLLCATTSILVARYRIW